MNRRTDRTDTLKKLFFSTLYLSTFTFGGGYVIVTLLKKKFVDELHWIDEDEILDMIAIAQSSPGSISVNGAIVVGYQLAGLPGICVSIFGAILPPFVILTILSGFYTFFRDNPAIQAVLEGMKAGVAAVILSVVYEMASGIVREKDPLCLVLMALSFVANYFLHVNIVFLILTAAGVGVLRALLRGRRDAAKGGGKE